MQDLENEFSFNTEPNKLEKEMLLTLQIQNIMK